MISYILAIVCAAVFLAVDQITKYYINANFELYESREFLNGFIDLVYIHNTGGAWGILGGKTWLLLLITTVLITGCIVALIKYRKDKLLFWAVSLVLSGGIGNMIDRIFNNGKVIDFLHFEFFPQFPIFNIADCGVVIGAGLLLLYFVLESIKEKGKNGKN